MDTSSADLTLEQFHNHCFTSQGYKFISSREAWPLLQLGLIMVDLRPEYAKAGKVPDIPTLLSIPYPEIELNLALLPRDQPVILADAVGLRSKECMIQLSALGYDNMVSLAGGLVEWEREGFPMKVDKAEQLQGACMCQLRKHKKQPNRPS